MNLNWEFLIEIGFASGIILGFLKWVRDSIGKDVAGLKTEISAMKTDVATIKVDISEMKKDIKSIDSRLISLEGRFQERGQWESRLDARKIGAEISPSRKRQRRPKHPGPEL